MPKSERTELQKRTDEKYAACLARGGHRPSGRMVHRFERVDRALMICSRCGVPYAPGKRTALEAWNSSVYGVSTDG